jgi:hypothetical protein
MIKSDLDILENLYFKKLCLQEKSSRDESLEIQQTLLSNHYQQSYKLWKHTKALKRYIQPQQIKKNNTSIENFTVKNKWR